MEMQRKCKEPHWNYGIATENTRTSMKMQKSARKGIGIATENTRTIMKMQTICKERFRNRNGKRQDKYENTEKV